MPLTVYIYSTWFLPAYQAGGPVQSIANLVAVPEPGVDYRIICSNRELDGSLIRVETDQWIQYNSWTAVYYVSQGSPVPLPAKRGDILLLNSLYSWRFTLRPLLFSQASAKILSARGMLHRGALSQKPFKKKLYLVLWKWARLHRHLAYHAADSLEERAIRNVFGKGIRVFQAANYPRLLIRQPVVQKDRGKLRLISVALISPMKNIALVLEALQSITDCVDYHIWGPVKDPVYWQHCLDLIKLLPASIRVVYHGNIPPETVPEALATGEVFILPSKSENFGHGLLEALSAGKPVITSHGTPWNNLAEKKAGINVEPTDTKVLATAIRFFSAMDAGELEAWSRGAAAYAAAVIDLNKTRLQYRCMFGLESAH